MATVPTTSINDRVWKNTYPEWTGPSQCPTPVVLQPTIALPFQPPPANACPNPLPSRPHIVPPPNFTSSRHIIPAAYPRTFQESTGTLHRGSNPFTKGQVENETKGERKRRMLDEAKVALETRSNAKTTCEDDVTHGLWIAGERWVRAKRDLTQEEGLTLVLSTGTGFAKECWIPVIRRLVSMSASSRDTFGGFDSSLVRVLGSTRIDEIWFLDTYHQGQSLDLNNGLIGPVHSWFDAGRDIANFVKHILPNSSDADSRIIAETLRWKADRPVRARKVVGLGHSSGGNHIVRAAQLHPELFHAIFLVDPMVSPIYASPSQVANDKWDWQSVFWRLIASIRRRTEWKTTPEALAARTSPFFSAWHKESFEIWETHHLIPTDNGEVTLATPSWAEAAIFAETNVAEAWDILPRLEIPCGFLMAEDPAATLGEKLTREMVWRPPMVANERLLGVGHLIVQEKPEAVAEAIQRFLFTIQKRQYRVYADRAKL